MTGTDDGDDIAGEKEQQIAQVDDGVEKAEWKPKNATDCCREQRAAYQPVIWHDIGEDRSGRRQQTLRLHTVSVSTSQRSKTPKHENTLQRLQVRASVPLQHDNKGRHTITLKPTFAVEYAILRRK